MEISQNQSGLPPPAADQAAARERRDALAAGRARNLDTSASNAVDQRERTSEAFAATREAIARVLGANTRLSISRTEGSADFTYRSIDIDSGEVVQEWPEGSFLTLIRGVREDVVADAQSGVIVDETA